MYPTSPLFLHSAAIPPAVISVNLPLEKLNYFLFNKIKNENACYQNKRLKMLFTFRFMPAKIDPLYQPLIIHSPTTTKQRNLYQCSLEKTMKRMKYFDQKHVTMEIKSKKNKTEKQITKIRKNRIENLVYLCYD